jgi:hypothetical protein
MTDNTVQKTGEQLRVMVPAADADMIRKVHRILKSGKNVEIRVDAKGNAKVFKVSKEIVQ